MCQRRIYIRHNLTDYSEIIIRAVQKYNQSINSSTNEKPSDILYNKINQIKILVILQQAQTNMLNTHSKDKKEKTYIVGEIVYEKKYGERNKLKPRYKKQVVKEDQKNKVI